MLCERKAEKDRKGSEPNAKNWWSEVIESQSQHFGSQVGEAKAE